MKKLSIFVFIAALLTGTVFAQPIMDQRKEAELRIKNDEPRDRKERGEHRAPMQNDLVSIEGTLKLEKGFVAVQSGESVYLVPMLNRYIGFISGLKEGEKVSVEGRRFKDMIHPVKLKIGEKSYDFFAPVHPAPRGPAPAFGKQGFNHHPNKHDKRKSGHDRGWHKSR